MLKAENVTIEYRWAHGQSDRLPSLAKDLVDHPVVAIFAGGGMLGAPSTLSKIRAHGIGALNAEALFERGAEVGTHRKLAMLAGERVLNQRLCALRLSYGSLEFQKLRLH